MGIFSSIKKVFGRGAKAEAAEKYILKKQGTGGGMTKVMELAEPLGIDDVYTTLDAGIYALHRYVKGRTGFDVLWGPVEVLGKEPKESKTGEIEPTAGMMLSDFLKKFDEIKDVAAKEYEILGIFFGGGGKAEEVDILDQILKAKDKYNKLGEIFGTKTTTTDEEPVKYKGELPIWMHPKVIDAIIEQPLARIEAFLKRTGLTTTEGEATTPPQGDMIRLPPKPEKRVDTSSLPKDKVDTSTLPKDEDDSLSLDDKKDGDEDDDEPKTEE